MDAHKVSNITHEFTKLKGVCPLYSNEAKRSLCPNERLDMSCAHDDNV